MKIGLFFGSFNPIHNGHLIIAQSFLNETDLDQVWFVVSPQNPLKDKNQLDNEQVRLELVRQSIATNPQFKTCDIEYSLPKPSYTINTLKTLKSKFKENEFILLLGSDSLDSFPKWKDYKAILKMLQLYVYPRSTDYHIPEEFIPNRIKLYKMPVLDISSTYIRNLLIQGKSIKYLVAQSVFDHYN